MPPEWVPYEALRVDAVPLLILLLFVLGWALVYDWRKGGEKGD